MVKPLNLLVKQLDPCDGYGRWGLSLLRSLTRQGVAVQPLVLEQVKVLPTWAQSLARIDWSRLTLTVIYGDHILPLSGRQWVYTMWEDTQPPPKWIDAINESVERLIVPCQHNAEAFTNAGVQVPVSVVPGGIDPSEFATLPYRWDAPSPEHPFTFMTIGDRGMRKGWEMVTQAFAVTFPAAEYPDVRLVIKTRASGFPYNFGDTRIHIWRDDAPDMADVLAQADCFVFASKGEGMGLPPREAAAMSIPTIATRTSGLNEGIDDWCTVPLSTTQVESIMGYGGCWDMADMREVGAAMKWVYDHPLDAAGKAQQNANWLRANQTWEHTAKALIALVEQHHG